MAKLIRGDGNGCLVVSKWLGMFIAFLTLASLIWGIATSYAMKTSIEPLQKEIEKVKVRIEKLEINSVDGRERFARVESKLDYLIERIDRLER